jgi:RimJ/RimL family protein N-acetyltransferase
MTMLAPVARRKTGVFEYDGLWIRPVEASDLEPMRRLRSDPRVWRRLGDVAMIDPEEQRDWFRRLRAQRRARYYVLGTRRVPFLGIVRTDEIDLINRSMRVGGDIAPAYQGRGYGRRMFELIKKYGFDVLNMNRLWLLVLQTNRIARALYRKAGFVEEGRQRQAIFRDGRYVDYVMMSMLRAEYAARRGRP